MSVGSAGCWLGPITKRLADAVLPVPPSVEVTALVVLFREPAVVPVTLTTNWHEALAASVALDRPALLDPAVAVIVPPPQLPERPLGVDTVKPAGNVSVKPIPLSEEPVLGFDTLNVRVVVPFNATLAAPNDFEIVGGEMLGGGGGPPDEPPPHAAFPSRHNPKGITSRTPSQ